MQTVELPMPDGGVLRLELRPDPSKPILFALGVRKSGSSLMNLILLDLAEANGCPVVLLPDIAFKAGYRYPDWNGHPELFKILRRGNLYAGFRDAPTGLFARPAFRTARKILLVRDPRDALVSEYFSDAYSHAIPKKDAAGEGRELFLKKREEAQAADIDQWVLDKVGGIRKTLTAYAPALSDPSCLVLRYEDFIFQKRRMIAKILDHFDWSIEVSRLNKLLAEIDVVPDAEDKSRFVRKVVPGDHIAKLKPETVRRLNKRLEEVMKLYDYY